jgi:DNA-binding XRE family transcriptional regulator
MEVDQMRASPPTDDLDRYIAERARTNRSLPARVIARSNRRILQHLLAERRVLLQLTQTEAAVLMCTSQSAIARLESGEHDVRVSTLERYAAVLGCSITMSLSEAS